MKSFFGMAIENFQDWISDRSYPAYRLGQVYQWMFDHSVFDFDLMSNLPPALREDLKQTFTFPQWGVETLVSKDGTEKYQFTLEDGKSIETVWIPEENRATLCVSSQVGCALKCQFCVTGLQGFSRNLTVEEIIEQVRYVQFDQKKKITNLVFMGMGEPLLNFENVCQAIELLKHPKMFNFGHRKISVSTAGMVPKILPFIERTNVCLAVSLTGSSNISRDRWMPINQTYDLETLKEVLQKIPQTKWKKIMFEVVMIGGLTDTISEAKGLITFLQRLKAKVNLIPYNENPFFPDLKAPTEKDLMAYQNRLMKAGIFVSIRKNRGQDIMGACGQLSSTPS